jgi:hypothetical protein
LLGFYYVPRPGTEDWGGKPGSVAASSFTSFQSALPSIGITKRTLKHLEAIQLVREQREWRTQELAYNARPFVLCGIPLRRPPQEQLTYARHNGHFLLEITAHPRYGLPYGQDRLIPIWVATLAVQQKSRVVHFSSAAQLLEFFRLPKDGPHYRRMVEGFQRVFAATVFFGTEQQPERMAVVDLARFQFFDRMQLWFNTTEQQQPLLTERFDNLITLSDPFYREIDEHRIPVEREVVAALAQAPGVLDFYVWLVWKSCTVNGRPVSILSSPSTVLTSKSVALNTHSRDSSASKSGLGSTTSSHSGLSARPFCPPTASR